MKVILCEDVENLGHMGDTVSVAPGYARNYLIPRKYAVAADTASAKQIEHELRIIRRRDEKRRKEFNAIRDKVDGLRLELFARAGEDGKLFGAITNRDIAEKLAELGHPIDRKTILLKDPLKALGDFEVTIRMTRGIEAKILVRVSASNADELAALKAQREAQEQAEIAQDLAAEEETEEAEA